MKNKIYILLIIVLTIFNFNVIKASEVTDTTNQDINKIYGDRNNVQNYGVVKRGITITKNNLSNILKTPYVNPNLKIYDYAKILNDDETEKIYSKIISFKNKTNMEFIIVTINSNYSDSENDTYASDFYDYNDFGLDTYNYDGLLLLRNANSMSPYYNLYAFGEACVVFPVSELNYILDEIYPEFVNKQYLKGINKVLDELNDYYDINPDGSGYVDDNGIYHESFKPPYLLAIIISVVSTIIIMISLLSNHKMVKQVTEASIYIDENSIKYTKKEDNKIYDHTRSYINSGHDSSGGSFGSGGGSFSSSGSSIGSSGRGHTSGGGRHG
ncbi:MAG: TPM domain-containing protein [Bacilli bacterium]